MALRSKLTNEQKDEVKFWIRYGCDLAACYSQLKNEYKERWGNNTIGPIPDYISRLENGFENQWGAMANYDDGVAIICGQLRYGPYKDKWITCLDFDSAEAFEQFCKILGMSLEELAKFTLVEWHGSPERIHVFLISNTPFHNLPYGGLEVKANKLLAFVSPSLHKGDNEPYRAYNSSNKTIAVIDNIDKLRWESVIETFVKLRTKDEKSYFEGEDAKKQYIDYLNAEGTILRAGERHPATVTNGTSMFFKYLNGWQDLSDDERFTKLVEWHNKHCQPTLFEEHGREDELQIIWNSIKQKYTGQRQQEGDQREDKERKVNDSIYESMPNCSERKRQSAAKLYGMLEQSGVPCEMRENIWTMVAEQPMKYIVARRRQGDICRMTVAEKDIKDFKTRQTQKAYRANYGAIVFRLFPKHVTLHESPLKFLELPPEYTIVFEDQNGRDFTVNGSILSIVEKLKEKEGYIVSPYGVNEILSAIIGAFSDDGRLVVDESVSFEGYYYAHGDIQISRINFDEKHPVRTKDEVVQCIDYLENRIKFQTWNYKLQVIDRRDLFATGIKWVVASPFNFAMKQLGCKPVLKGFDMTGESDGGKSGFSAELLGVHGHATNAEDADSLYSASAGSMNTKATWGKGVSKTTYAKEVSEWAKSEDYGRNEDMVEMLLVTIDLLVVRRGRGETRYDQPYASCSPLLINGNPIFTRKSQILKRFHVSKFSEADKHSNDPNSDFNVFQKQNKHLIKILGDWTMRYIYENRKELLLSRKYNIYEVAEKALLEFYKFGGKEDVPEWLKLWVKDSSLEDLNLDEESIIRSILYNHVNKTLSNNSLFLTKEEYRCAVLTDMEDRINTCIDKGLWPWIRESQKSKDTYFIDTSIMEIFSHRLPDLTFTKFGEKTRFEPTRGMNGNYILKCTKKSLCKFIESKDIEEGGGLKEDDGKRGEESK